MRTETFETYKDLIERLEFAKKEKLRIIEIFSLYPIYTEGYNIAKPAKYKLNSIALIFGVLGFLFALLMQYYIHSNWVLNFGGKPSIPIPSFFFVAFEITILSAVFTVSIYFFFKSKIYRKKTNSSKFSITFE